ncbi:hypothetical protein AcV5_001101 [Taiwanofungus camphoratus]|nr:hypothetical protein AcV5_001101 [Antrodia cinnamomea]
MTNSDPDPSCAEAAANGVAQPIRSGYRVMLRRSSSDFAWRPTRCVLCLEYYISCSGHQPDTGEVSRGGLQTTASCVVSIHGNLLPIRARPIAALARLPVSAEPPFAARPTSLLRPATAMFPSLCLSLLLLLPLPLAHAAAPLRVLHRIYDPSRPAPPFAERGALHIAGTSAQLVPAAALPADLPELAATAHAAPDAALYQVALERPGDTDPARWHISAVKACHLPLSTAEALAVHTAPDGTPFALDHFLLPVPHDGACPSSHSTAKHTSRPAPLAYMAHANASVRLVPPRVPPRPSLHAPPPVTPEGTPVAPVPEKSFLQKYWMYIAVALLAILITPAGEEEGQGQGQGQGGGRAQGGRR